MAAIYSLSTALQRHFTCCLLVGVVIMLRNCSECLDKLTPINDAVKNNETGICKSVDIRNSVNSFENLRGCRVVEGFVQILLFDNVNESLFANISFPELREITDYLLMYRVNGLRSLAQLFPNLAVIRGQNLFYTYAFVVFEMSSLQEVGLYSLTDIIRGAIRIDKNPSLCFVNTIDWELIAHENGEHFIRNVKPESECPLCPGDDKTDSNLTLCPVARARLNSEHLQGKRLCWNRQHCQKVCKDECRTCNDKGECCDKKCLGGCYGERRDECHVCKNVTLGSFTNSINCTWECPQSHYMFLNRRCLSRDECINMRRPLDLTTNNNITKYNEYPYKIFNGSCLLQCPTNYMDDYENHTCKPCAGRCKKECPGINVDSIATVQELRGCTHINGSLEIKIRGGRKIVQELESNLNMIEEIDGYVKIVRSFPLITLNFFKSLRVIHGNNLENQKYVFIVLDNQNLEVLWDLKNRSLEIKRGRLFFHFNPKLCTAKIHEFAEATNKSDYNELEVASNGDKIACNLSDINVTITVLHSKAAVLTWPAFSGGDYRKLLGYIVSYIDTPYQNVTLYDGRDACGGDGWKVVDVSPKTGEEVVYHLLSHLNPYTQYAFYVKTYTIANEQYGAQSPILYLKTLPSNPSQVENLQVNANGSDSVTVKWRPPEHHNGNLTHYIVSGIKIDDSVNSKIDYCNSPIIVKPEPKDTSTSYPKESNDTCVCTSEKSTKKESQLDLLSRIHFEDQLQNRVYVKNSRNRSKREVDNALQETQITKIKSEEDEIKNETTATGKWKSFRIIVKGKTELYVDNLQHYAQYNVNVQACREKIENDTERACSYEEYKSVRTLKKSGVDNITNININIANESARSLFLSWDEPTQPNGPILAYQIEYKRADIENHKPLLACITQTQFKNSSRRADLQDLEPGSYSLRVKVTTKAGDGDFSEYITFKIEQPSSNQSLVYILLGLAAIIILFSVPLCMYKKRQHNNVLKMIVQPNPDYVSAMYTPDDWEVPRKKIELIKELGQGSFGMVYEGIARDIQGKAQIRCAVKTVNEHATNRERIEFLNEASVMKGFDTAHVVRLLGVVSQGQPTLVVMELMANGDLKSYLRSHRPDTDSYDPASAPQPPSLRRIMQMAVEIADGMAYLAAKKFVHRDLAARNCMVSEDLTVKIGDFGMTRDIYETDYYRKGTKGLLPVRWMAPESLKDGVFTSNSDIWSYGVVLWEMATLASQPYQGLSNDQVLRYVINGGIMERPENCPDKLYNLMQKCWHHRPTDRPTFLQLCCLLAEDASPNFSQVSFYHSSAGLEARTIKPTQSVSQDDPTTPLRIAHDLENDFSPSGTDQESDIDFESDTRIDFGSFPSRLKDTTANGYISGCTKNGAPT